MAAEDDTDWASIIRAGVFTSDESIILISKEGKQFIVKEQVAKSCTPYFEGLLGNGMREAGEHRETPAWRSFLVVC
jgi:hypothetical protein